MLEASDKIIIDEKKQHLMIKNADKWKSGKYSCFATNAAGISVATSTINILGMGSLFSTYAKCFEKLTFLTPWYAQVRVHVSIKG